MFKAWANECKVLIGVSIQALRVRSFLWSRWRNDINDRTHKRGLRFDRHSFLRAGGTLWRPYLATGSGSEDQSDVARLHVSKARGPEMLRRITLGSGERSQGANYCNPDQYSLFNIMTHHQRTTRLCVLLVVLRCYVKPWVYQNIKVIGISSL